MSGFVTGSRRGDRWLLALLAAALLLASSRLGVYYRALTPEELDRRLRPARTWAEQLEP